MVAKGLNAMIMSNCVVFILICPTHHSHQIQKDVPRMHRDVALFQQQQVQEVNLIGGGGGGGVYIIWGTTYLLPSPFSSHPVHFCTGCGQCFERILFIWSMRHPASGYVQGINDLVTPFFVVFLSYHICKFSPLH